MKLIHFLGFSTLTFVSVVTGFPAYGSLAGLSIEERDLIISGLQVRQADPAPGPLNDTSAKLVNDKDHPFLPLQPDDIRGPCPGLNTLASHGVCHTLKKLFPFLSDSLFSVPSTQWYCYSCPNHQRCSTRCLFNGILWSMNLIC
jgi:hypothetical protein